MDVNWDEILTKIGSTAVIVAALGWLARSLISELFKRNLEDHKNQLKRTTELELKTYDDQSHTFCRS